MLVVAGLTSGLLLRLAVTTVQTWRDAPTGGQAPDELLSGFCAGAAGMLLAWLCLGALMALVAAAPGRLGRRAAHLSARLAPSFLRATVAVALGGTLAISVGLTPSLDRAARAGSPAVVAVSASGATADASDALPDPGWRPAPPPPPARTRADAGLVTTRPAPGRSPDDQVVVHSRDTLWSIAARHLGRGADAAAIAREWPRWFAANRAVIGDDPNQLRPGQRLVPPR